MKLRIRQDKRKCNQHPQSRTKDHETESLGAFGNPDILMLPGVMTVALCSGTLPPRSHQQGVTVISVPPGQKGRGSAFSSGMSSEMPVSCQLPGLLRETAGHWHSSQPAAHPGPQCLGCWKEDGQSSMSA